VNVIATRQEITPKDTSGRNPKYGGRKLRTPIASAFVLFFFISLLFISGCTSSSRKTGPQVEPIDEKKLNDILQKNRGQLVLLNFWATWCVPCVEELPDLVRVANENAGRLTVIAVSIDEEEDIASKVIPFLQKYGAPFSSYIKKTKDDEVFINSIDPKWSGAIPATFIYGADGTLRQRMIGQQDYEKFSQAVQLATASQQEGRGK
jgi:thiol-disulfide isomerase/thioredoxin